ncbi:MFS transporter, partial [Pseudoxanthomonas sp. SGD-10]
VVTYFTVEFFEWRTAYFVGGGMGISLLLLRLGVFESGVFEHIKSKKTVQRGNFFSLFTNRERLAKYLKCIGIGVPTWFVIGILATFSNEFGAALNLPEPIKPGLTIMWAYVGLSIGDLASGFISHALQSRKKAVFYMMLFTMIASVLLLYGGIKSTTTFYGVCLLLGFGIGYWAMFVTIGAEQFGTNLRATAATTVPNMVRGTVVMMTTLFTYFKSSFSVIDSGALLGLICFVIGFYCILTVQETHNRDLDFIEE